MTQYKKPFETLWEMEKMLVTSIISLSHNVFYPTQNIFQFFSHIYFVVLFSIRTVAFTPLKKAFALRKFEMAMEQPTLPSFHFKNSSSDKDKPSPSTSEENSAACSPSIPDAHGPQKSTVMFHFNETYY